MVSPRALTYTLRVAVEPPPDPGFGALRRAARAAIVIPAVFAFADLLLREPESVIYVVFDCGSRNWAEKEPSTCSKRISVLTSTMATF